MSSAYALLVILLLSGPYPAEASFFKNACGRLFGQVAENPPVLKVEARGPTGAQYPTILMQQKYRGENFVDVYGAGPAMNPVRYFKDQTRQGLEISVDAQGLLRKADGSLLNTCHPVTKDCPPAIFAMSGDGRILVYDGDYLLDTMEEIAHSSLFAGGPVASAGEIFVKDGKLLVISNRSGHYVPTMEQMRTAVRELEARGADLSQLKQVDDRESLR